MSKLQKKMSLADFHKYVNDKYKTTQPTAHIRNRITTKQNGRSADINVNNNRQDTRNRLKDRFSRPLQSTSASVTGRKPVVAALSLKDFPPLTNFESESDPRALGRWGEGIQSIVDAKDLPDPSIQQRIDDRVRREESVRYIDNYSEESYDNYDQGDEFEPNETWETNEDLKEEDDVNWDHEL